MYIKYLTRPILEGSGHVTQTINVMTT